MNSSKKGLRSTSAASRGPKTSKSPAPSTRSKNLVSKLEKQIEKKSELQKQINKSKKTQEKYYREIEKNSLIDLHIQELNRKILEERQICQLLLSKVKDEEKRYYTANNMLNDLKTQIDQEKVKIDKDINNQINTQSLLLDEKASKLDNEICTFQQKKDDCLLELSTKIVTDQESKYYQCLAEKKKDQEMQLKEKKDHYLILKDKFDNDKRKIDVKLKRVINDYERVKRENEHLEQEAKKNMANLKNLQETMKEQKKNKMDKAQEQEELRAKIYKLDSDNHNTKVIKNKDQQSNTRNFEGKYDSDYNNIDTAYETLEQHNGDFTNLLEGLTYKEKKMKVEQLILSQSESIEGIRTILNDISTESGRISKKQFAKALGKIVNEIHKIKSVLP